MIRLKSLIMEYVGRQWSSCKAWKSKGGTSYWDGSNNRPKIEIDVDDSGFEIRYKGKASGYAISHAKNGTGDTLHQVFNVIVCECNPYLLKGKLKPDIQSISTKCTKSNGIYDMTVSIPFEKVDEGIYQINRRGGMGWDPTAAAIKSAVGKVKNMEGPVKVVVKDTGVIITEYFVTYDTDPKTAVKSVADKDSKEKEKEKDSEEKEKDTKSKTDVWYKYPGDRTYVYKQIGNMWTAKNVESGREVNISTQPNWSVSADKLDKAKKDNKLTKVK